MRVAVAIYLFPVLALLISVFAYFFPALLVGLKAFIVPLLVVVMLAMGLTLQWRDFAKVWQYRRIVGAGVAIQFIIMPFAAWLIALLLGLSEALMTGMMLVGATAGGTASNVMAYLAKGNVALSVSMTMISTLVAVILLPLLTWLYLGQSIEVPALSMLDMLAKVILLPVAAGMLLNHFFEQQLGGIAPACSLLSMAAILLIIAIVVALNSDNLNTVAWPVADSDKLLDDDKVVEEAISLVENSGIVFLDEIDKICAREGRAGADVSREGVQRDLLPLIEGTTVATKHGPMKTDHILFIASGAFHVSKPSDMLPELQGRLPIRVELRALTEEDFVRILKETRANLVEQYKALIGTENVTLDFTEDAITEVAKLAARVNETVENIGARRLQTVMERLLEEISFEAEDHAGETIMIDAAYVRERLETLAGDTDLSKYIL